MNNDIYGVNIRKENAIETAKKTVAKKAPAKKTLPVARAFVDDNKKQYSVILGVLMLTDDFEELTNSITGEVQYKLEFEYSDLFMTACKFRDMILDNCDTIYDGLLDGGYEKMINLIDNIQSNSKQLKVVAHKKTAYTYDYIESYSWQETTAEIELKKCDNITAQSIIDTLLI